MNKVLSAVFLFVLLAATTVPVYAQQFQDFLSFPTEKERPSVVLSFAHYFSADLQDQPGELEADGLAAELTVPLFQDSSSICTLQLEAAPLTIHSDAILPNAQIPLPERFWETSFGVGYKRLFNNRSILSGNLSVETKSDDPYHRAEDNAIHFLGSFLLPHKGMNSWLFLLDFDNRRSFWPSIPIPGLEYLWIPSEKFMAMIGAPVLFARWAPTDRASLMATYFPAYNLSSRFQYRIAGPYLLFTGYSYSEHSFFRSDRNNTNDQIHFFQSEVASGIQGPLSKHLYAVIQGKYGFGRFIFEGEELSDRQNNRINVEDGFSVSVTLNISF